MIQSHVTSTLQWQLLFNNSIATIVAAVVAVLTTIHQLPLRQQQYRQPLPQNHQPLQRPPLQNHQPQQPLLQPRRRVQKQRHRVQKQRPLSPQLVPQLVHVHASLHVYVIYVSHVHSLLHLVAVSNSALHLYVLWIHRHVLARSRFLIHVIRNVLQVNVK